MPVAAMATTTPNAVTNARCIESVFPLADDLQMKGASPPLASQSSAAPAPEDLQNLIDFLSNDEWDHLLDDVNRQIQAMEELPAGNVKTAVFELLQGVDAIHREALRRLVRLFKEGVLEKVVSDPAIHTLMDLYDLLPAQSNPPASEAPVSAADKPKHRFPTIAIKVVDASPAARPRYPHWVPVLQPGDEMAPHTAREVDVDGLPLLLVRHVDQLFALASRCAQDGSSLKGATLSGYTLACPNHSGCYYDVRQGSRMGHNDSLDCFSVKQEPDGKVLVGLDMDFTPSLPSF